MEVSAPGRICLFGDHQDYLGLPVISMAISLRARITGALRQDRQVIIHKPDLDESESFSLNNLTYSRQRDYFKSGIIVCRREGLAFSSGLECELTSDIPIKAGSGSSSAVMVNWIHFLSRMADIPPQWMPQKIGELAYQAEVLEFSEPGGMMDQITAAMGSLIYLESEPEIKVQSLSTRLGTFVLGDSQEPKDTMGILRRCRDARLDILKKLQQKNPEFDLHTCGDEVVLSDLSVVEKTLFEGTIHNRNLLEQALNELEKHTPDHEKIGRFLSDHHRVLRDVLQVSTPKVEAMLEAALDAGALGGKINGSGGGGCMFAYSPENAEEVVLAIERSGGKAYIIDQDTGVS